MNNRKENTNDIIRAAAAYATAALIYDNRRFAKRAFYCFVRVYLPGGNLSSLKVLICTLKGERGFICTFVSSFAGFAKGVFLL